MNITIIGRVRYVSPTSSYKKLEVTYEEPNGLRIVHTVYDPTTSEPREIYDAIYPIDQFKVGQMYALVRFWDAWTLVDYQVGMSDGVFNTTDANHAATMAMTNKGLVVFPHIPVPDGLNVTYIPGSRGFWVELKELDPDFIQEEVKQRTKAEIAVKVGAHSSIAALEAQVDLLTRTVIELLKTGTSSTLDGYYPVDEEFSLLNLKSSEDLIKSIKNNKHRIRFLQDRRQQQIAQGKIFALTPKDNDSVVEPIPIIATKLKVYEDAI